MNKDRNNSLVSTQQLEQCLRDSDLRIFDVSVILESNPNGYGYLPKSGYENWSNGHIPGGGFLDVIEELSDQSNPLGFMMPPVDQLARTLGQKGIVEGSKVILYNSGIPMWATRVWWMLRSIGLRNVAVLDGGWDKWCKESRPVSVDPCQYEPSPLSAHPEDHMWIGKNEMLKAVENGTPLAINALSPAVYSGKKNQYGRPGHLPGSWNVYYADLIDDQTGEFKTTANLIGSFEPSGALDAEHVITYCGGGISATALCFALHLCGQENVAVYDGSMSEWVRDDKLPLKLGNDP